MPNNILEMKNITKKFPGTLALNDVSFTLRQGEIMALIGENGAGKSTLMNVLMGNIVADEGKIFLKGKEIVNRTPFEALKRGIAMVPQELNLARDLTVAENICLGIQVKKKGFIDWKGMYDEAEKLLGVLDIKIDVRKKAGDLSAAYQQLVVIARTLREGSDIIILDEPTASLTTQETEHLLNIMKRLAADGKSLIMITHHLDEVKIVSDRFTVLRDGCGVMEAETADVTIDDMITAMANQKVQQLKRVERAYSEESILEVRNLTRNGEFRDVSFDVKKGEIFGIAGLLGSGRTELINCIYGLTKKESGQVFFDGKQVEVNSPIEAIELGMGLVPEERRKDGIFAYLSVQENIMLPSYDTVSKAGFINYHKVKHQAVSGIEKLGVKTASENSAIMNLSGGNQQKAILARWVEKKPTLLFMDEPTRGIDVRAKAEIYTLVRQLADNGMTVVIVSSEIDEVLAAADRVMVMFEGDVKGLIVPDENTSREDILKIALS